jgi:hypothetical protein
VKSIRDRAGRSVAAAAVTAAAAAVSLLAGAGPATAEEAVTVPVAADGTVAADPAYDGPQITEVRVINEGRFLEISWDRYVDETAAVSPENVTLAQGDTTVALTAKPATGPTDTIFFDQDNKQIAASDANSMARLPDDLHLASIAYTGTLDPDEPLTVTVDGSQIEDAEGRPARDVVYSDVPRLDYYTQSVTTEAGIVVKANPRVDPATLDLAAAQVDVQLGKGDNGIADRMADFGCSLAVYAARENAYLVPEHRGGYDPEMYDVEGYGGSEWNGCVSSISERNVLRTRGNEDAFLNTGYPNENILVHEFGHAVRLVGIETLADPSLSDELYAAYENSWATGRWPNTYAIGNIDEYFATLSAIWFDVMAEKPDWTDGVRSPINTRAELQEYDPQAYELFAKVYPADLTLPAPWDEPAPDVYHGDHTQLPERPEREMAQDVDFAADTFRIVTDGIGTEYQVDRYAGDGDHPERDMVVWSRWGDGVWTLDPAGGGAYTIAASDGSGALAAVSGTEVRYAGITPDPKDARQRWTFAPDVSTEAEPYDGQLVNAATGGALDVDGRTTSGVSLTLTDPADATRWLLEDTTRTAAQGVGAYLLPDVTAPVVTSAWAHPNRKSLTLDATDDASGVALLEYRVGAGDWTDYDGTVRLGPRDRVEARATDRAGNVSRVLVVERH